MARSAGGDAGTSTDAGPPGMAMPGTSSDAGASIDANETSADSSGANPGDGGASDPTGSGETGAADAGDGGGSAQTGEAGGMTATPGSCPNAWTQPDVGCPSPDDTGAFSRYCAPLGIQCLIQIMPPDSSLEAVRCEFPANAAGPLWTFQGEIYERAAFDALAHEIVLDASDCPARPATACHCGGGGDFGTTEDILNYDGSLWEATYGNPQAYVVFTDDGCAARVRYGDERPATADYASKLAAVYAGRRWTCATSGTHFVMFHTIRPVGPQ
jgi:hypothetical protein